MDIDFRDDKLRALCERQAAAEKRFGAACARKLRTRLAELDAAGRVTELVAGRPHPLKGDRAGEFALDLAGGTRLTFTPDHNPCPCRDDDSIDWSRVTKVRIVFIGDYHD
ncbi:type II toxin-antitoxin system RelE/ParE family toxin [Endothiovibrio diazotrophicus]